MKKPFFLLLAVAALSSTDIHAQMIEARITGTVPADVKTVIVIPNRHVKNSDTVKVADGKFESLGRVRKYSFVDVKAGPVTRAVVIDSEPIDIDFTSRKISGSYDNEAFGIMQNQKAEIGQKIMALEKKNNELRKDTSESGRKALRASAEDIIPLSREYFNVPYLYAIANKNLVSPAYYLNREYRFLNKEQLRDVCDSTAAYYHHPWMRPVINLYKSMLKREPGRHYEDLEMQTPKGKTVSLSKYVGDGHYTLVLFWAPKSEASHQVISTINDAYKVIRKDKSFEVVGVAICDDAEKWREGIKEMKMTWPQISDLKDLKSDARVKYGISFLPCSVIIDPDGVIVASDLQGPALIQKLVELHNKSLEAKKKNKGKGARRAAQGRGIPLSFAP